MELSIKQKAAYGIGAVGKDLVYGLSASFVMYFYNEVLGLSAAFIGLILLIARVFDAANDPLMGVIVGKTKTRWGRFRPWLFTGTVINAFVLYAMYAAPNQAVAGEGGLMIYFSVTYILWGLTYTMMDIPFWAMIPAVTRTPEARENLSVIGRTCAGIGGALITALTMMAVQFLGNGNEQEGFRWFALIIGVLFIIFETITCIFFKENAKSKVNMETSSVKEMFSALFRNDQAIAIVVSIVLFYLAWFVATQMFLYYFKYDVGFAIPSDNPSATWKLNYTIFTTVGSIAQILAMMLLYPALRKKFSNPQIFTIVIIMSITAYAGLLACSLLKLTGILPLLCIFGAMAYMGNGMLGVLCTLFLANSVDYGQLKTGKREESMIFSMQTFVVKAGSGFASFMAGLGIDAAAIKSASEAELAANADAIVAQSASTVMTLDVIMCVPPIICLVLALLWFKWRFTLTDERSREILEELKAKGMLEDDALVA